MPEHVTQLLHRWQGGHQEALDELVPIVYQELHRLAAAQLRKDQQATIQCTELVSEAYLKLTGAENINWHDRNHFFSLAAKTMRRVLVERYRRKQADKRGNNRTLEQLDPRQAEIVTLKFFGGLKGEEIAELMDLSTRTVKREWAAARLWLFRDLMGDQ